jgi:hypothetical protein
MTVNEPIGGQGGRMKDEPDCHSPIGHPLQRPSFVDEGEH